MKYLKTYAAIFESRKTEAEGLNILTRNNVENPEDVLKKIKEIDTSDNQRNIPFIAIMYTNEKLNLQQIKSAFDTYNDLLKRNLVGPITIDEKVNGGKTIYKLKINDKIFDNFIRFTEFIDGKKPAKVLPKKGEIASNESEDKPIYEGNGISVYQADDVTKCIRYSNGELTGRTYPFCIGKYSASENMYFNYRDEKASTFYFIVDKNRSMDDPVHMVVYDATEHGVELTDANNTTGNIAEYGGDVDGYEEYLKSKGVPVDKMVNIPRSQKEIEENEMLREQNDDLEWFKNLPIELRSKYVLRGHLLTDDQFDYLYEDVNPNDNEE